MSNFPLDPLLFYLRDHELYYTALSGPRYNEYAIFIDYHEWELSANGSFYQYLKIIKAYRSLLQMLNKHPVLIVLPTGYIETCRWFNFFTYWKEYNPCILQFVQRVIPDVHICPQDYFSYHLRFMRFAFQVRRGIQHTCLQMNHINHNHKPKSACQMAAHYDIFCTLCQIYESKAGAID